MSNNTVTGIIQEVVERALSTGRSAYDIFIVGDERQFGAGFKRPNAAVGDTISFTFFVNAAGYNNIVSPVKIVNKAGASRAGSVGIPVASTPASKQTQPEAVPDANSTTPAIGVAGPSANVTDALPTSSTAVPQHRQQAWGYAATRAIDFLRLAHETGALKAMGGKAADKLDALKALLDEYTVMLYNETINAKVFTVADKGVIE